MNTRIALSSLLIVIGAMVVASQRNGLLEKSKVLETSWTNRISQAHSLLALYHSCTTGNQPGTAITVAPEANSFALNFADTTHCLSSHARHLQQVVLNLLDSDR